jgi:hypothetical protein
VSNRHLVFVGAAEAAKVRNDDVGDIAKDWDDLSEVMPVAGPAV